MEHKTNILAIFKQWILSVVVVRFIYIIGNFLLVLGLFILIIPMNIAYIFTGKDYAIKYIKWANNVFES